MRRMRFKQGDKLLCINSDMRENEIELNKIYTFMKYFDNNISPIPSDRLILNEVPEKLFMQNRFIRANSQLVKERLGIK